MNSAKCTKCAKYFKSALNGTKNHRIMRKSKEIFNNFANNMPIKANTILFGFSIPGSICNVLGFTK